MNNKNYYKYILTSLSTYNLVYNIIIVDMDMFKGDQ